MESKSKYSACRKQFSRSSNLTLLLFLTGVAGGKMCDDTDEAANALKLIKGGSEATQRDSKIWNTSLLLAVISITFKISGIYIIIGENNA